MAHHMPKTGTRFVRHNGRLALFHQRMEHRDYWRDYWTDAKLERMRRHLSTGALDDFGPVFTRYLPRRGLVLEAGCGAGFYVAGLLALGYLVTGIDYEPEVIRRLLDVEPDLPVEVGDITATRFFEEELSAYVSLGVIEHFEDGCEAALDEMARIVEPEGVALVSVPYLNPARARLLDHVPSSDALPEELSFHQYYYSADELSAMLARVGFETVEIYPYDCEAFLTREHPFGRPAWHSALARDRVKRWLRSRLRSRSRAFRRRYGHMVMAVARKRVEVD